MDREIPKEVRNKERNKKIIRYSSIGVAGIVVIGVLISVMRTGVEKKDLVLSTVDKGMIEVSVSASGKVVPAFEEIINSPFLAPKRNIKNCLTKNRCAAISWISFASIIRRNFPIWRCRLRSLP